MYYFGPPNDEFRKLWPVVKCVLCTDSMTLLLFSGKWCFNVGIHYCECFIKKINEVFTTVYNLVFFFTEITRFRVEDQSFQYLLVFLYEFRLSLLFRGSFLDTFRKSLNKPTHIFIKISSLNEITFTLGTNVFHNKKKEYLRLFHGNLERKKIENKSCMNLINFRH